MRADGIIFDLGNTLVPWGEHEAAELLRGLKDVFEQACGPLPDFLTQAVTARDRLIRAHEDSDWREVTCEEYVAAVLDGPAPPELVAATAQTCHDAFVRLCRVPDYLPELLADLARERPLAICSNFFLESPIEAALRKLGIREHFVHVEVSAASGWMKPHPSLFERTREALGTPMERTLMVGDDFFADIVGGHQAGLLTALTHEHRQTAPRDARAPHVQADRILQDLGSLRHALRES